MRSKKYNTVKKYYDMGIWHKKEVADAVFCKYITAEEYEMITGETFVTYPEQVEYFYKRGRIDNAMVAFCVGKGITEKDYEEITGEPYPAQ